MIYVGDWFGLKIAKLEDEMYRVMNFRRNGILLPRLKQKKLLNIPSILLQPIKTLNKILRILNQPNTIISFLYHRDRVINDKNMFHIF